MILQDIIWAGIITLLLSPAIWWVFSILYRKVAPPEKRGKNNPFFIYNDY